MTAPEDGQFQPDETSPLPVAAPSKPVGNDTGALARAMQRVQRTGAAALSGGELIPRKCVSFDLPMDACAPGVFDVDLRVTLRALDVDEEMQAHKGVQDAAQAISAQVKASLWKINGQPLGDAEKLFAWEALSLSGRQLVTAVFNEHLCATLEQLGKVRTSSSEF